MKQFLGSENVPIFGWTSNREVEPQALEQLRNTAKLPFIFKHLAVMPDVHLGIGATVGSVVPTKGAVIPAAVGVDIGCGMCAIKLSLKASDLPDSLHELRLKLEEQIPVGQAIHERLGEIGTAAFDPLNARYEALIKKYPEIQTRRHPSYQIGSLGGGNHFIELCLDEDQNVWVMLHSGSRGIGNRIGSFFIEKAREEMRRHFINLPDKDLAYLVEGSELFNDYVEAVSWAQEFAMRNRKMMLDLVLRVLGKNLPPFHVVDKAVNCHHNYIDKEHHYGENIFVTRKGAVRARLGDLGIIPGSMGTRSYIVRGLGNAESFCSCSHGAGRVMSRGKAKEAITIEEHAEATKGVECRKDSGVLDESPAAYKDIDKVMEAQQDLVEIIHTLKQVMCIKG